ncbi:uncharacterized protein LOC126316708 isoform X1 [Schistocerca gregaria]|uniref:uncharacterized protein LOC126316708 isoform X1 n=1 Tax=Schistocerca gregaria TaxID=7010 RepID=UPI00211EA105|nr:uncharacterized protein LOC126316708 isoform X1 [Schistocerca gregaria]
MPGVESGDSLHIDERLEIFSDQKFDAKAWINNAVSTASSKVSLLKVSDLRTSCQQLATECNHSINGLYKDCLNRSLCMEEELQLADDRIQDLSASISDIFAQLFAFKLDVAKDFDVLSELDQIKKRIESCLTLLYEADRFKNLTDQIDQVFLAQDANTITEALAELIQSYELVRELPEFRDESQVQKYRKTLKKLIKPRLMEAIEKQDERTVQVYLSALKQTNQQKQVGVILKNGLIEKIRRLWDQYNHVEEPLYHHSSDNVQEKAPHKRESDFLLEIYKQLLLIIKFDLPSWVRLVSSESSAPTVYDLLHTLHMELLAKLEFELASCDLEGLMTIFKSTKIYIEEIKLQPIFSSCKEEETMQVLESIYQVFDKCRAKLIVLESLAFSQAVESLKTKKTSIDQDRDIHTVIECVEGAHADLFELIHSAAARCTQLTTDNVAFEMLTGCFSNLISDYIIWTISVLQSTSVFIVRLETNSVDNRELSKPEMWRDGDEGLQEWDIQYFQIATEFLEMNYDFKRRLEVFIKDHMLEADKKQTSDLSLLERFDKTISEEILDSSIQDLLNMLMSKSQTLLYDTMFICIQKKLNSIPHLSIWNASNSPPHGKHGQIVPRQPSCIEQVAEHLLILPRYLERIDQKIELEVTELCSYRPTSLDNKGQNTSKLPYLNEIDALKSKRRAGLAWTCMKEIAVETQRHMYEKIFQIPKISEQGAIQLGKEIEHLFNVLSALRLPKITPLSIIADLCKQKDQEYIRYVSSLSGLSEKKIAVFFGKIRGLLSSPG